MDSSTTNASPARCVLIKREFGTPAVLKCRNTYKNKYALRGYVMRYVIDALRTSVSNTLFRLGELGLGPLGGLRLGEIGQNYPLVFGTPMRGEAVRFTKN